MSTPRTDEVARLPYPANIPALIAHGRQLETELNACREALAKFADLMAEGTELSYDKEAGTTERALAAALRDLSKPTPENLP